MFCTKQNFRVTLLQPLSAVVVGAVEMWETRSVFHISMPQPGPHPNVALFDVRVRFHHPPPLGTRGLAGGQHLPQNTNRVPKRAAQTTPGAPLLAFEKWSIIGAERVVKSLNDAAVRRRGWFLEEGDRLWLTMLNWNRSGYSPPSLTTPEERKEIACKSTAIF